MLFPSSDIVMYPVGILILIASYRSMCTCKVLFSISWRCFGVIRLFGASSSSPSIFVMLLVLMLYAFCLGGPIFPFMCSTI